MKILLSHFSLYRKNGWGRLFEEAKGLASLGHDVTVYCSQHRKGFIYTKLKEEGVTIIVFNDIIPISFLHGGYGCVSLISKYIYTFFHKFDVCLSDAHRPTAFKPCLFSRFIHNSKVFIEWWDDFAIKAQRLTPRNPITKYRIKNDLKAEISSKMKADGVVSLSKILADKSLNMGIPPSKIKIVHGGCDTYHIKFNPLNTAKASLGIANETVTFGFIGCGDVEISDLELFFDACLSLYDNYKMKFLNYGNPFKKSAILRTELKDLIVECGWVDYYGDNTLLSATDVFVLIKKDNIENNSGWPNKFGDYLAIGRPIIVNPYGEIIPFSEKWHPSIIPVENTKESITQNIEKICSGKFNLSAMAVNNRKIAEQNTWYHRAQELESFFYSQIGQKHESKN